MNLFEKILSLLILVVGLPSATFGMQFEELYVKGGVDVQLINRSDSIGHVCYDYQASVEVKNVGGAYYIIVPPESNLVSRTMVTIYSDGQLKVVSVTGRASLTAEALKSSEQLSLVASGGASMTVTEVAAANVNVSLSGSGEISIPGSLAASTLNFSLVGSGTLKADLITASRMTVNQRGSGKMFFGGSAHDCSVVGRGTGSIDLRTLVAGNMDLKYFGEGRIFYPAGIRVTIGGDTDRIIPVKPYQPL